MPEYQILLFAGIREIIGSSRVAVYLPEIANVQELRRVLQQSYPAASTLLERSRVAVNLTFASDDQLLQPTDELAIIPPVSGG